MSGSSPSPKPTPSDGWQPAIARFFRFGDRRTDFQTECLAGFTTFMTMAYILVANPAILSNAIYQNTPGDLAAELAIATALSAAIASLLMGLTANYPFALAPGMGINAYFTFAVVVKLGIPWSVALAAVLVEGLIFIALTLSKVRSAIVQAIPASLKHAMAAGIGLFLAYTALAGNPDSGGSGIIVADPVTLTTLSNLNRPESWIALVGLLITSAFMVRRVQGALILGVLATAILGWIVGAAELPKAILQMPDFPTHLAFQSVRGLGLIGQLGWLNFATIVATLLFVDLFDTVGTLAGVGTKAGYIDRQGRLPKAEQALMSDAIGTVVGSLLGTSTVTTYIESSAGIAVGGRTGLTAIATAALFIAAIPLAPIFASIPLFATAPALIIVAVLMMGSLAKLPWDDPAEAIPAFLTAIVMPLSYSIADGLAIGLIVYPLLKTFQGKLSEVGWLVWALAGLFVLRFAAIALQGN